MSTRKVVGILGAAPFLYMWAAGWIGWLRDLDSSYFPAVDYELYMEAARRWLAGGSFYAAHQLAGPYDITPGDILYPPYSLALFAPATILPAILWWAIPLGLTAYAIWRLRPGPLSWPLLAALLWWPPTNIKILTGNPVMWVVAGLAMGTLYAWPSVMVLLKPSLIPFALVGIRRRSWWFALSALGIVGLLFLPMWPDYITVLRNSSNGAGLAYSAAEIPTLFIPIVAGAAAALRERGLRERLRAVDPMAQPEQVPV